MTTATLTANDAQFISSERAELDAITSGIYKMSVGQFESLAFHRWRLLRGSQTPAVLAIAGEWKAIADAMYYGVAGSGDGRRVLRERHASGIHATYAEHLATVGVD